MGTLSWRTRMGIATDGLSYWQAESGFPLLNTTVGDLLDRRAAELPNKEAVVYSGYPEFGGLLDIRWTYATYRAHADAVAQGLMAIDLRKGDHIAVWAANLPEWLLLQMAAAKAGLVLVTVNPALRAQEVEYILKQGDIQALFFMARVRDHDCLATIRSFITPGAHNGELTSERLPQLRYASLLGPAPAGLLDQQDWRPTLFSEIVAGGSAIIVEKLHERSNSVPPRAAGTVQYPPRTS